MSAPTQLFQFTFKKPLMPLSYYMPRLLRAGEEERFMTSPEPFVVADTSGLLSLYYDRQLWASAAIYSLNQQYNNRLVPVIIEPIWQELTHLVSQITITSNGSSTNSHNSIDVDFQLNELPSFPKNPSLEGIVLDTWKSVSPKLRHYMFRQQSGQQDQFPPRFSEADCAVVTLAVERAKQNLPTIVFSGDTDITYTIRSLKTRYPALELAKPAPPEPDYFVKSLSRGIIITHDAAEQLKNSKEGDYLLIRRSAPIIDTIKHPVAYAVATQKTGHSEEVAAYIALPGSLDTPKLYQLTKQNSLVAIAPSSGKASITVYRWSNFLFRSSQAGPLLHDPSGFYNDLSLNSTFDKWGIPKKERQAWLLQLQKGYQLPTPLATTFSSLPYICDFLPLLAKYLGISRDTLQHTPR